MFAGRLVSFFYKYAPSIKYLLQIPSLRRYPRLSPNPAKYSPIGLLLATLLVQCDEKKEQPVSTLEEVTMRELVSLLHEEPSRQFVVIVYDKFKKNKNAELFASELKEIVQQCKQANIHTIYTINSKNASYLREIVRRLKNQPQSNQQAEKTKESTKTFECYFKSKSYNEAFQLLNSRDYTIQEQIKEVRKLQIPINDDDLLSQLEYQMKTQYSNGKSIVVKQCVGNGECVESFRREVKQMIDHGLLTRKSHEFDFRLVVDYPTGILNKSTDYVKRFQSLVQESAGKKSGKKEETYLFRRDMLGGEIKFWNEWMNKEGGSYEGGQRMLMFLRPRVQIISKYSTFTDMMWYLRTSRNSGRLSLSLNNTGKWSKSNSESSVEVLRLLYANFPNLNFLIINSRTAGEIFHHVHSDFKYVLFEQSSNPVWNKQFLDLDKLENSKTNQQRIQLFNREFKEKIASFIQNPVQRDLIVVEKEHEINLVKLKSLRERQMTDSPKKQYILRICDERCGRYLSQSTIEQLEKTTNQKLDVYWIDNSCQNIGVGEGDYLLAQGKLTQINAFLQGQASK